MYRLLSIEENQVTRDLLLENLGNHAHETCFDDSILLDFKNFEYFMIAKLFDKSQNIVRLGEFFIKVGGGIPEDLQKGDLVELYARRIDIY